MMDITAYLNEKKKAVDDFLNEALPPDSAPPQNLHRAMRYSLFAGGKRIRPIMAIAAFEAVGGKSKTRRSGRDAVIPVASSLELIHTYSLIHDDLPAMDDDDYRRGKPTNHKLFGEAVAILAGDALLTIAFDLLSRPKIVHETSPEMLIQIIQELAQGAGHFGMVGGQVVDIESEGKKVSRTELEYIHRHKTAALIRASVRIGGLLANATKPDLAALTQYGEDAGLAFQIVDDVLDVVGTQEEMGKNVQSDSSRNKNTYPALFGVERSRQKAAELLRRATKNLERFGEKAEPLREIAHYIVDRRK
jgi:geranylgeranyl diphosphate synthase type II